MKSIKLPSELKRHIGGRGEPRQSAIAMSEPFPVSTYENLTRLVASVSAMNPGFVPYFRGQNNDYRTGTDSARSTLLPSIYRSTNGAKLTDDVLVKRFEALDRACELLVRQISRLDDKELCNKLSRRRISQWAILQHYCVCPTPLIDVTQSLRIACMFAFDGCLKDDRPVLYVVGLPYSTGPVTFDVNNELFLMRLLSMMPPAAERPFFQEGFLVGSEFPKREMSVVRESDLVHRVCAKFELVGNRDNWKDGIGEFKREAIYPDDQFSHIAQCVKLKLIEEGLVEPSFEDVPGVAATMKLLADIFPHVLKWGYDK